MYLTSSSNDYHIETELRANLLWTKSWSKCSLDPRKVQVWKINTSEHFSSLFKNHRSLLVEHEYLRARKYFREVNFKRFLTSRIVVKLLSAKYLSKPAETIQLSTDSLKPRLISDLDLKFNLSYSGEDILLSIGQCETGVDIEKLDAKFKFDDLLQPCFSPEEILHIKHEKEGYKDFFFQWTRKEAILKFSGQGIRMDLSKIPSLTGKHLINDTYLKVEENIKLISFEFSNEAVGSIVLPSYISDLQYIEWNNSIME